MFFVAEKKYLSSCSETHMTDFAEVFFYAHDMFTILPLTQAYTFALVSNIHRGYYTSGHFI